MIRILLVDDEPMILRVMSLALRKDGYQVDTAMDGQDALEKIAECCPDVLVTDIEMPRMTGEQLCKRIQELMPDRSFPIFVSTSLTALQHREWAGSMQRLVFLEKPISVRKLRCAIAAALDTDEGLVAGAIQ